MGTLIGLLGDFVLFALDRPGDESPPPAISEAPGDAEGYEALYREALRALDHQRDSLDELRARSGVLLGAGVVVAGLLGPLGSGAYRAWPLNVLAIFLITVASFVLIVMLMPKTGWRWGVDIKEMLLWLEEPEHAATASVFRRTRAYYIAEDLDFNAKRLDRMGVYFGVAAYLFGAAVLAWLIELALGV